jgi:DNA-binding GntR family transcriptional regulator
VTVTSTPKRERVARGLRAAILRGDYADGFALSQGKLAAEYGVNRHAVWSALAALEREGHVSSDARNRFHVNASYASQQLQLTRNRLELVERYTARLLVILGRDPSDPVLTHQWQQVRRGQSGAGACEGAVPGGRRGGRG